MKKVLLIFFLLPLSLLAAKRSSTIELQSAATLFNVLLDCPTEQKMAEICQSYKMTPLPSSDGFQAYQYKDGTVIRFKMEPNDTGKTLPVVEVQTNDSHKKLVKLLSSIGYTKEGNRYIKGHRFGKTLSVVTLRNSGKTLTLKATKVLNTPTTL